MMVKKVVGERFQDYRKPSLFVATAFCDWKCCTDAGRKPAMCQNSPVAQMPTKDVSEDEIFRKYVSDPITQAVVIGGLEPLLQQDEVISLIRYFREHGCEDEFVIYTGYYKFEIEDVVERLAAYQNVIVKFGRYIPYSIKRYDPVLGVELSSNNQHAEKIS